MFEIKDTHNPREFMLIIKKDDKKTDGYRVSKGELYELYTLLRQRFADEETIEEEE